MNLDINTLKPNGLKGKIKSFSKIVNAELQFTSLYNEGLEIELTYFEKGLIKWQELLQFVEDEIHVVFRRFLSGELHKSEIYYKFNTKKQLIYDQGDFITYDANGLILEKVKYDKTGDLEEVKRYRYDKQGNKIEKCSYDAEDILRYKSTWDYDENGKLLKWETFDSNERTDDCEIYIYDEKGNLIEEITFWYESVMKDRNIYKYDENGRKILWVAIDEKNGCYSEFHYEYKSDAEGNIIEILETDEECVLRVKTNYEYDEIGNIVKETEIKQYKYDDSPILTTTSYNITYE